MEESYEVIIVGAGPAGAAAAKVLFEAGVKVLVIEQKRLPRYKCCAGLYSERAIDFINNHFGRLPGELCSEAMRVGSTISKRATSYLPLPGISSYNLKRAEVDNWLIESSGVEVVDNCTLKAIERSDEKFVLKCSGGREYPAKQLIAADGADSAVRGLTVGFGERERVFCVQHVYRGDFSSLEDDRFNIIRNKKFASPGGLAWWLLKDGLLYIGSDKECYSSWIDYFFELNSLQGELVRREGAYRNNFPFEAGDCYFGENNILVTGEAAGLVSVGGEGISSALISGMYAAQAILQGGDVLENYLKLVSSELTLLKEQSR